MAINRAFAFLRKVGGMETRKWNRVPQARISRKETVRIEPKSSLINSSTMRTTSTLKLMRST